MAHSLPVSLDFQKTLVLKLFLCKNMLKFHIFFGLILNHNYAVNFCVNVKMTGWGNM